MTSKLLLKMRALCLSFIKCECGVSLHGSTHDKVVFTKSIPKLTGIIAIGLIFIAINIWLINGGAIESRGPSSIVLGWFGLVIFGIVTLVIFHKLTFGHRQPLVLSPDGFWDKRFLKRPVPWTAVSRISVWSHRSATMLRIDLVDDAASELAFTKIGLFSRWINKPFWGDGVYVTVSDLDTTLHELCLRFKSFLAEYNPTAKNDTKY